MSDPAPIPAPTKSVADLSIGQRVVLWILGTFVKLWARTLRVSIDPADRAALGRRDRPVALVVWHNRLFMATDVVRRFRGGQPFHGLVSASKDGAWLVGFFATVGIKAVRGSSSWGAREAASAMIAVAREGGDIGITPDGPRGPCYEFKPGGLIIARRADTPMLLVGMEFAHAKQLRSWDRFIVPRPFSRMRLRCREVLPANLPRDRDAALAYLATQMAELNGTRH